MDDITAIDKLERVLFVLKEKRPRVGGLGASVFFLTKAIEELKAEKSAVADAPKFFRWVNENLSESNSTDNYYKVKCDNFVGGFITGTLEMIYDYWKDNVLNKTK
jgi:hypothetical protein